MKRFKRWVLTFLLIVSTLAPMTVYAEGEGNIDNGGGGLGQGTNTNYWNKGDEGVRATVVSASDGSAVTASIDLTNRSPSDIKVHFGKVCKSDYRGGAGLSAKVGGYDYYVPAQSLPKIITTSSGSASIAAIKSYFTDEQVIRSIAGYVGMDYDTLTGGDYKLLLEPIAYVTFEGVRTAFTATEAAMYNQVRGGMVRKKLTSLTHKNLPLAMFLETSDLGYPAWGGSKNQKVSDEEIIGSLGLGIVRFNEVVTPEVIAADYEYRVNTDVVTAVTVSGGQSDPDNPVSVTFHILGRSYTVNNVYYPEDGQQLVWVKWHTPSEPCEITINIFTNKGSLATTTIRANVVDLNENPPPDPMADDRYNGYSRPSLPTGQNVTSLSWGIWRCWWHANWVWVSDWGWESGSHSSSCPAGCTSSHGHWVDNGEWEDQGWYDYALDTYSASLSAAMRITPDEKNPTASGSTLKSGYGINMTATADMRSGAPASHITQVQTCVAYFPEFHYTDYWRLLEPTSPGYPAQFEFQRNEYSTYNRRTHFTPVWFPDGNYTVYAQVIDAWTPAGMLQMHLNDTLTIHDNLFSDWHVRPLN